MLRIGMLGAGRSPNSVSPASRNRAHRISLIALAAMSVQAAAPARADEISERLDDRALAIDHLRAQFSIRNITLADRDDPFDWNVCENRGTLTAEFRGNTVLLRPNLQITLIEVSRSLLPEATHSWVNGQRTAKTRGAHGNDNWWTVVIDRNISRIYGPIPLLTPLELHCLETQSSLRDIYASGRLAVRDETPDSVVLEGRPLMEDALTPAPWTLKATLDKNRQFLPVHMSSYWPQGNGVRSESEMRVTASHLVGDVHVIKEAIIVFRKSTMDYWAVFLYRCDSMERDRSITLQQLEIELPNRGYVLFDDISGIRESVDLDGNVMYREVLTPEEIAEHAEAIRQNVQATAQKLGVLEQRNQAFIVIVILSAVAVALMCMLRIRRRRIT